MTTETQNIELIEIKRPKHIQRVINHFSFAVATTFLDFFETIESNFKTIFQILKFCLDNPAVTKKMYKKQSIITLTKTKLNKGQTRMKTLIWDNSTSPKIANKNFKHSAAQSNRAIY